MAKANPTDSRACDGGTSGRHLGIDHTHIYAFLFKCNRFKAPSLKPNFYLSSNPYLSILWPSTKPSRQRRPTAIISLITLHPFRRLQPTANVTEPLRPVNSIKRVANTLREILVEVARPIILFLLVRYRIELPVRFLHMRWKQSFSLCSSWRCGCP